MLDASTGGATATAFADGSRSFSWQAREGRAERLAAALGDPGATLEDYAELNKNLAQLERYERRAFSRRKTRHLACSFGGIIILYIDYLDILPFGRTKPNCL